MPILALDYGTKNIGVAISNPEKTIAWAHGSIKNTHETEVINILKKIILKKEIQEIVIGLPLDQAGNHTQMSEQVEAFVEEVQPQLSIPFEFWNETLTTKQALQNFKVHRGKLSNKDSESARIILQEYLDHHGKNN